MKKTQTRRALLMSVLSLLLCCSMLIGTTFAWFTDTVESGKNQIIAGNLDVELKYGKVENGQITAWDTVQGKEDIFDPNALWEPGRVEVVYLEVSNLGTLALKYQLGVNVYKEIPGISVETNEAFKLSEYLYFKVVNIEQADGTYITYSDRQAAQLASENDNERGLKDYNGNTTTLEVGGKDYVALIVYMPETVGNEANYRGTAIPTIELGVNLFATQVEAENDSFGNDYDEDAWHPDMKVYNAQDLQAAVENAQPGDVIELQNNIELSESLVIPAAAATYSMRTTPAPVVIDLNGKTLTGTVGCDAEGNRVHVVVNNGNAIIKNGTVKSADFDGGSAIYNCEGAALTLEKVTALGAPQKNNVHPVSAYPSYAINNYGDLVVNGATVKSYHGAIATGGNGTAVINDVTIDVGMGNSTGITSYAIYAFGNGEVTINGGNFAFTKQEVYVNGGNMFCELGSKPIVINGGTFVGGGFSKGDGREYVIKGGAFSFDTTAYVAEGYKAVANNGTYYVVPQQVGGNELNLVSSYPGLFTNGTDYYVFDAQGLISMRNFWVANTSTNKMWGRSYNVMADINAAGYTWNEVWVNVGDNNNNGFVFDGNGHTITGLAINGALFGGTPNGGNKPNNPGYVKNITFDGVKVTGDHFAGVLWSNVYNELVVENVSVINSEITGKCNVAALVGGTVIEYPATDASVKFINCVVKNNVITAEGKAGQDPNGANAFLSRAFGNTAVIFEGTNVAENNTFANENGLVGGGIYGYTSYENGSFVDTGISNSFINWKDVEKVTVSTAEQLKEAFKATVSDTTAVINITADIQLAAGETWTPLEIDPYIAGTVNKVIVNGNGHTISGLNAPLFGDVHFGGTVIEINDLTLDDCQIINQIYNSGLGAFVAYADNCDGITLKNCHLTDSVISATGAFTGIGGLVGYSSSKLTITDCSVVNTTVNGAQNSAGAIAGHVSAGGAKTEITNAEVVGCTIKGQRADKSGYVVGTANDGNTTITTSAKSANNTVYDVANSTVVYGRLVGGTLTVNGVAK